MFARLSFAFSLFLFSSFAGVGQKIESSTISGKLDFAGQRNRILNVTYRKISGGFEFDSSFVIDGQFKFEKKLSEPIIAIMALKPEPGTHRVNQVIFYYIGIILMPGTDLKIHASENF